MLKAITRSARLVDNRVESINAERKAASPPKPPVTIAQFFDYYAKEQDTQVVVTHDDFVAAQRELVPSVSAEEIGHYERVRKEFEGDKDKEKQAANGKSHMPSAEQLKAMQQKMIEDMLAHGLQDGSIARGKKASKGNRNGFGPAHDRARQGSMPSGTNDQDDTVIRTDHLALNGHQDSAGKGKGKGKMAVSQHAAETQDEGFGDATEDQDLY